MRKSIITALLGKNEKYYALKNVLNHYIFVNKFLLAEVFCWLQWHLRHFIFIITELNNYKAMNYTTY